MVIQKAWLPVVHAAMNLHKKRYADVVAGLQSVTPYEKGQLTGNLSDSCMIPAYLRGEAELGAGKGAASLVEFQKFSTNAGVVGSCWSAPLAKLGEARARALTGPAPSARDSYAKFFQLWKDADADIPVLKQAKAEAAKLH